MSRETDIQRCQQRIALHTDSVTDPWPQQRLKPAAHWLLEQGGQPHE
ncbi:hypothetical protein [Kushneria pakistanensis]|nr:hypothetical protein [Kushneria pakistanensis]